MTQAPDYTQDAFHRGRFWLVQPRKTGHRAGADALILAAAVPSDFAGRLADFGAGTGAASMAVLSRCEKAQAVLVESAPEMARFAEMTLAHPHNAGLSNRASVLVADVTLAGEGRERAGLVRNTFDFVIMNPPFNAASDRASPDMMRQKAHVMTDGMFESWIRSAAAVVKPSGRIAIIARPQSLGMILAAMEGRFGGAEIVAVHARAQAAAIRIVVRAKRGTRAQISVMPPLVLHEGPGNGFSTRAEAIYAGTASLLEG